jgi:hypothetical protein
LRRGGMGLDVTDVCTEMRFLLFAR